MKMRILFTGASSFTGMWFIKELAAQGHDVAAIFQHPLEHYTGVRKERVEAIAPLCRAVYNCSFGTFDFIKMVLEKGPWDLFCHHAADVTQYKSDDFNVGHAVANNVHHLKVVLESFLNQNCRKILLTGSVFEPNEGKGTLPLKAFSPYGLSKGLTFDIFQFYAEKLKMKLGKFVIPNPFGPYEEARFTSFLIQKWTQGETAQVTHPDYIRDNIPVSLLAKAYVHFAEQLSDDAKLQRMNPSCYADSQGNFTKLFAKQMESRLSIPCRYNLLKQTDFSEPLERVNTDSLSHLHWDEQKAWDELAAYYKQRENK